MNVNEISQQKIDASCRVPLLALFGGAALWLVVGLLLAVIADRAGAAGRRRHGTPPFGPKRPSPPYFAGKAGAGVENFGTRKIAGAGSA